MRQALSPQRLAGLRADMRAVLAQCGPQHVDELRERLCVASRERFNAAVAQLVRDGVCLRTTGRGLRLVGDEREYRSQA